MEVEADCHSADGKAREQDTRDEFLRRKTGQCRIEAQYNCAAEPSPGEKPQFRPLVREPEQRLVRVKEAARMRFESDRRRRSAEFPRTRERGGDHGSMAAVHAIEITDRDDGAA